MLVVSLDPNQGDQLEKLFELNKILLLRYHSPRCGHCIEMEPEWKKVGKDKRLEDANITVVDADVGIVESTSHPSAKDVSKKGVPTIYLIKGKKTIEHKGGRNVDAIVKFALREKDRYGGKKKRKTARRKKTGRNKTKRRINKKARKTKRKVKRKMKRKTKVKK